MEARTNFLSLLLGGVRVHQVVGEHDDALRRYDARHLIHHLLTVLAVHEAVRRHDDIDRVVWLVVQRFEVG